MKRTVSKRDVDLSSARLLAFREYSVVFSVPPVCTAYWDEGSWIKHVDWTIPRNRQSFETARTILARQVCTETGLRYHTDFGCNKLAWLNADGFFEAWIDPQPICFTCDDKGTITNANQIIPCPKCSELCAGLPMINNHDGTYTLFDMAPSVLNADKL